MDLNNMTELEHKSVVIVTNGTLATWFKREESKTWASVKDAVMAKVLSIAEIPEGAEEQAFEMARIAYNQFNQTFTGTDESKDADFLAVLMNGNQVNSIREVIGGAIWRMVAVDEGVSAQQIYDDFVECFNNTEHRVFKPEHFDLDAVSVDTMTEFVEAIRVFEAA